MYINKQSGAEQSKRWKKENPDKVFKMRRAPTIRYGDYRYDATVRRKLPFEISLEVFTVLFTGECHYCGTIPACGLDRKDNSLGYTESNVLPCCVTCNRWKQARSYEDFINHVKKIVKHLANQ